MLKYALHKSERRHADYTFFSDIVCTQASVPIRSSEKAFTKVQGSLVSPKILLFSEREPFVAIVAVSMSAKCF